METSNICTEEESSELRTPDPDTHTPESDPTARISDKSTWGSGRLRERKTMRLTEAESDETEVLQERPTKSQSDDTNTGARRGRPRKRQSDGLDVVRKIKYSLRDRKSDSANKDAKGTEETGSSEQDNPCTSAWRSRLRGRGRPKKKISEEDISTSDPENSSENKEVDMIANVNLDHIQKLEEETKYQCTICMKKFRNESSKTIHVICKLNEKLFFCEYCRQKELSRADYETHLQNHTGKRHFVCHYCGEWFLKRRKWIFHILLHEGRSHFSCKPCKQRFPYFKRKTHIRSHSGEQQFTCQKCKEQYTVNVNEKEICDGDEEKQPAAICVSCGEKFRTKFKYYSHVLTESKCHYSCDECASQFARKKAPFKCRGCKAEFTRKIILESHKKCSHPSPPKKVQDRKHRSPRKAKKLQGPKPDEEPELTCENPTITVRATISENNDNKTAEETLPHTEEPVGEPIEPLSSVKIKTSSGTIFIFERVTTTLEKWQQTNANDTEFILDNDFCSQCHYSFDKSSPYYTVNTMCGHLLCEPCFLDDNEGCLLCIETTNHFDLQNLSHEEKDSLTSAIEVLRKLAAKQMKDDVPDICVTENENFDPLDTEYPMLLSCIRGDVEKSISDQCIQFP